MSQPDRFKHIAVCTLIVACVCCAFILIARNGPDADLLSLVEIDKQEALQQAELRKAMRADTARIARQAREQGMREALAGIEGTPRGDAFERSCARLWAGGQP